MNALRYRSNELGLHPTYPRMRAKVLLHSGETPQCAATAHHWVIEAPAEGGQGRYPLGQCKHCQRVRRFENFITINSWITKPTEKAIKASQAAKVAALSG
jgi:hypothetical protein